MAYKSEDISLRGLSRRIEGCRSDHRSLGFVLQPRAASCRSNVLVVLNGGSIAIGSSRLGLALEGKQNG